MDTAGGQSGGGVYRIINNARYVFAVHAYSGATTSSATRVNNEVFNHLRAGTV